VSKLIFTFISLVVQELVQVGVGDLLDWFDIITRNELVVSVEKLDSDLLEGSLGEKKSLDSRQTLVRVVVGLVVSTGCWGREGRWGRKTHLLY
jgi:hypothetical protein